jgi:hypothetical protein
VERVVAERVKRDRRKICSNEREREREIKEMKEK